MFVAIASVQANVASSQLLFDSSCFAHPDVPAFAEAASGLTWSFAGQQAICFLAIVDLLHRQVKKGGLSYSGCPKKHELIHVSAIYLCIHRFWPKITMHEQDTNRCGLSN